MDEREAPLLMHLTELRICLVRAVVGLAVSMVICYVFADQIMLFLRKPMMEIMPEHASFVVLSPYEYFFTELKAALFFGLVLSSPWMFLQIWRFVAPGLYANERTMLIWFIIAASACFVIGVLFAYFLVFPPTFKFFIDTLPDGINGAYSISMLYGFAITVLLAFGVVFQTPIAVFLLVLFDLVPYDTFAQYRRLIFVLAFVVGALLTPPDPITQVMLAIPTYLLFEAGLFFARITIKKRTTLTQHTAER
jgi:sec-independent protein translocase protein TatC